MNFEMFFLNLSICSLSAAMILSVVNIINTKRKPKRNTAQDPWAAGFSAIEKSVLLTTALSLAFITVFIIARTLNTGHGPFTSMYEFSVSFVWGILLMNLIFSFKYRNITINMAGLLIGICLIIYARSLSSAAVPLVPALQNSLLLTIHVISAVIAYGAFTIGFVAALFFVIQKNDRFASLLKAESLESIGYHSVVIGFPFMTLVIVLGAIWANIVWGRYWGWDPKETASLVTWFIYAGYLHTRTMRGWQGKKSALVLIIGFIAVLFTFFGNYIFGGLHSY
jgi:cytochrome c-type biogenesis protein CcsB